VPEHRTLLKFIGSCEVGATGIEPYCGMIVTELVEYGSLADVVHNVLRSISFRLYLRIASDVATALVYLHDGGFVHGALRPSNVMLLSLSARAEFVAKLQDYGASPQERLIVSQSRGDPVARTLPPEASLYGARGARRSAALLARRLMCFRIGLVLFESFARQLPYLGADSLVRCDCGEARGPGAWLGAAGRARGACAADCRLSGAARAQACGARPHQRRPRAPGGGDRERRESSSSR
jgi:serine/threonine protein kinase